MGLTELSKERWLAGEIIPGAERQHPSRLLDLRAKSALTPGLVLILTLRVRPQASLSSDLQEQAGGRRKERGYDYLSPRLQRSWCLPAITYFTHLWAASS